MTVSTKDLLNLRLVNRLFQEEGSKALLAMHDLYSIYIRNEARMKKFLSLMKIRQEDLRLRPLFPFSSFRVRTYLDCGLMETFVRRSAGNIRRLDLSNNANTYENVVTALSHSPRLVELKLISDGEEILSPEQLAKLPVTFHELRDLSLGYLKLRDRGNELCPLFEVLLRRAPRLTKFRVPVVHRFPYAGCWYIPDRRILRLLVETHSSKLPLLSFADTICIDPEQLPILTEFMDLKYWELDIKVKLTSTRKREFDAWLGLQSNTLLSLKVCFCTKAPETLPPLAVLQELDRRYNEWDHIPALIDPNCYPSLRKLFTTTRVDDAMQVIKSPMESLEVRTKLNLLLPLLCRTHAVVPVPTKYL